ncbi:MAG: two component transcriptional regulator, LuxR family [Proteobacteria bacterium]|nr:two component transcriptional regulator, LuxR family [Pseudomonadota bacterium]
MIDPHDMTALILVVEDDPNSLANTALILELEGFAIITAANGSEGLAQIRAHRPQLVVCDMMMPGLDGMGLLAAVRATPEIKTTSFLFLTALTDYGLMRNAMNAGADDYLTKPYTAAELLGAIRARLKRLASASPMLRPHAKQLERLSAREREILTLIGHGLSSQQIAERLSISRRTVDSHRAHIIDKLNMENLSALMRLAVALVYTA